MVDIHVHTAVDTPSTTQPLDVCHILRAMIGAQALAAVAAETDCTREDIETALHVALANMQYLG